MDLKSGYPFWAIKNGLIAAFPKLHGSIEVDALVVGGGITAALISRELVASGMSVAVVERRDIGWGSTSASTALLQYEIDTEFLELSELVGEAGATLAYLACADSVRRVLQIARGYRGVEAFPLRSLYYASHFWHGPRLRKECAARRGIGLDVELVEHQELRKKYAIDAHLGLLSQTAAALDPYQLAYAVLRGLARTGIAVHDHTVMSNFKPRRGGVDVEFESGASARCKHLVLACGYETQAWLDPRVARNRSSYAYITDPQETDLGALANTMIWESARPYLYLRRTRDRRLLIGGEDDEIDIPARRDGRVASKAATLQKRAESLFPAFDWTPAFAWAGTFAETEDGLPWFGPHEQHGPHVHFAMAYGGNGITYSQIGAEILAKSLCGEKHPLQRLFSFSRLD